MNGFIVDVRQREVQRAARGDTALHPPKHVAASPFSRRPTPAAAIWRQQRETWPWPLTCSIGAARASLDHGAHHFRAHVAGVASLVQHSGVCAAVHRGVSPRPRCAARQGTDRSGAGEVDGDGDGVADDVADGRVAGEAGGDSTVTWTGRHHRGTFLDDAWRRPVFCAWSGEVGRQRPCHGEPVPIDLRFQLHQATHLEADHLGLLVAYDQQRGKPAEERHVADERKRLVLGLTTGVRVRSAPAGAICRRLEGSTRNRLGSGPVSVPAAASECVALRDCPAARPTRGEPPRTRSTAKTQSCLPG